MKTALIVVDVQNFFLRDAPENFAEKVAQHIRSQTYDAVGFTIFKNNETSNFIRSLHWNECSEGEDVELPPVFDPFVGQDNVFARAAYSGFTTTKLNDFLIASNIEKVVLCGVDTDACVLATAFSAFDKGFLVDVNFANTFSSGNLEKEAQAIIMRNLSAR